MEEDIENIKFWAADVGDNQSKEDKRFEVYSIIESDGVDWCHWAKGLTVVIIKDGVTISLNSEEIQKVVKSLPRTVGGSY